MTLKILRSANQMFTEKVDHILYCFGQMQPKLEQLERQIPGLILHQGLPSESTLDELETTKHNIICLDNVAQEAVGSKSICKLVTMGCHHHKFSLIFLTHNAFERAAISRMLNLNVNYIILFKNVRDEKQVRIPA